MSIKRFIAIGVFIGVSPLAAQKRATPALPPKKQVILPQVGQTRDQVLVGMGVPSQVYQPKVMKYYPTEHRLLVIDTIGDVADVYRTIFGGMEFEMLVYYLLDAGESRLHPANRVSRIVLTPDKQLPALQMVKTLPWTAATCVPGCRILQVVSGYNYFVYVYRKSPGENEETPSKPYTDPIVKGTQVPALTVRFNEKAEGLSGVMRTIESLTVDTVEVSQADPVFEKSLSEGRYRESDWAP